MEKEESKLLKGIKGLFVKEIQEDSGQVVAQEKPSTVQSNTQSRRLIETSISGNTATNNTDQENSILDEAKIDKVKAGIMHHLESTKGAGVDFMDFLKINKNLLSIIPDENVRLAAVISSLKATSPEINGEFIANTASKYIEELEKERTSFLQDLETEKTVQVTEVEYSIQDKLNAIEERKKQIELLTNEITSLETEISSVNTRIQQNRQNIQAQETIFDVSYNNIKTEITNYINKLKTII